MEAMASWPALFMLAAPTAGAGGAAGGGTVQTVVFIGLIFVVFWFFMIRPQRQKQKQREAMLKALAKGDRVVTIGGIRGVVAKVGDGVVSVKVSDSNKIDFSRSAISEVLRDKAEAESAAEAKDPSSPPKSPPKGLKKVAKKDDAASQEGLAESE